VIGTLSKRAEQEGFEVFMVTPTKITDNLSLPTLKYTSPTDREKDGRSWVLNRYATNTAFTLRSRLLISWPSGAMHRTTSQELKELARWEHES
jgi:hypothetical protein